MSHEARFDLVDGELQIAIDIDPLAGLTFDAPLRDGALMQFYAPFRDRSSMSNVARAVFQAARARLGRVNFHNFLGLPWIEPAMMIHHGIDRQAPVGYFIGLPRQVPDFVFDHPVSIGAFVCETDRILDGWVEKCNRFDLVTVPSHWCRDAFIASGVTVPVRVVPHGLEPAYHPRRERRRDGPLVFFNTFHSHSFIDRKGFHELVRAFLRAFADRDDAVLVLRTNDFPALADYRDDAEFQRLVRLDIVDGNDTTDDYAAVFSQVHCTVHPSRGEGFGLVPLQSIACETPVIAPRVTGMADYLADDNSIALATRGRTTGQGVGNAVGEYFLVDEDDLVIKLRYVADHWETEYRRVQAAAPAFRQAHAWPTVLAPFLDLVEQLAADPSSARERLHGALGAD